MVAHSPTSSPGDAGAHGPGSLFRRPWLAVPLLTLALGGTVLVSWFVFGGSAAFRGPMPVLRESWALIHGGQAAMAAGVGFVFARWTDPPAIARLVGAVFAAWVGELVVLAVGGTLLANELVPEVAWFYWLIGTGGPIQPLAAVLGGLPARRSTAA